MLYAYHRGKFNFIGAAITKLTENSDNLKINSLGISSSLFFNQANAPNGIITNETSNLKLTTEAADMHVVFSTDCSPFQDWQVGA
jgi:hypothetical protein